MGDVDHFDSLMMDFYNAYDIALMSKINSITKNDAFTPSNNKSKIDDEDTSPKQKGQNYTREKEIARCRSFINQSENAVAGAKKTVSLLGKCV